MTENQSSLPSSRDTKKPQPMCLRIKCDRGGQNAYEGDSVGITFAKKGNVHSPVTHQKARTITTMCDHDIGVVVYEGTITKSGDYGPQRKTSFNKNKKEASTIRTTIDSEGGELIVLHEKEN